MIFSSRRSLTIDISRFNLEVIFEVIRQIQMTCKFNLPPCIRRSWYKSTLKRITSLKIRWLAPVLCMYTFLFRIGYTHIFGYIYKLNKICATWLLTISRNVFHIALLMAVMLIYLQTLWTFDSVRVTKSCI